MEEVEALSPLHKGIINLAKVVGEARSSTEKLEKEVMRALDGLNRKQGGEIQDQLERIRLLEARVEELERDNDVLSFSNHFLRGRMETLEQVANVKPLDYDKQLNPGFFK